MSDKPKDTKVCCDVCAAPICSANAAFTAATTEWALCWACLPWVCLQVDAIKTRRAA